MLCSCFCMVYFLFPIFCHLIFKIMWNVHSSSHEEWIQQQLKHIILLCMEDAGHLLIPDLQNNVVHLHRVTEGGSLLWDAKTQALWEARNLVIPYLRKKKICLLFACLPLWEWRLHETSTISSHCIPEPN